jgi:hypothetical protein
MTTYVYEPIHQKGGGKPRYYEIKQKMDDKPLTKHLGRQAANEASRDWGADSARRAGWIWDAEFQGRRRFGFGMRMQAGNLLRLTVKGSRD